jgi:FecR protein
MTKGLGFRALIAVAALTFSFAAADAATQIGKVVAVKGVPSASGPGGDRKLKSGSSVFEDDKISVGAGGNAQIILNDNTKLVVGPSSSLLLDRFVMKGGSTAQKVSIKTLRGTFRFITGKSAKSAYSISTSSATIGIRGTGFDWWDKRVTGVAVMNGNVRLCDGGDCVNLSDTCEVGQAGGAGGGGAQEFTGADAGAAISNNLPFVINQSPLDSQFHLPINRCRGSLIKFEHSGRSGGGKSPDNSTPDAPSGFTNGVGD